MTFRPWELPYRKVRTPACSGSCCVHDCRADCDRPAALRSYLSSPCEHTSQPLVAMAPVSGISHPHLACADNKHCPLVLGVSHIVYNLSNIWGLPFLCPRRARSGHFFSRANCSPNVVRGLTQCQWGPASLLPVLVTGSDLRLSQPDRGGTCL